MSHDHHDLFIAGRLTPARSEAVLTTINPATEEPVGSAPDAGADELGALVTMENGMALSVCGAFNGIGSATRYRYFAGLAESWDPEEVRDFPEAPGGPAKIKTIVRRQPAVVVGIIVPWNVPRATWPSSSARR